jgi:hypothetical protein
MNGIVQLLRKLERQKKVVFLKFAIDKRHEPSDFKVARNFLDVVKEIRG